MSARIAPDPSSIVLPSKHHRMYTIAEVSTSSNEAREQKIASVVEKKIERSSDKTLDMAMMHNHKYFYGAIASFVGAIVTAAIGGYMMGRNTGC
jgi:hypothetical protein